MLFKNQHIYFHLPTKEYVQNLSIGDQALDCFGRLKTVSRITTKQEDGEGNLFVIYYTRTNSNSEMSMSQKEGELTRTVAVSNHYSSNEIDVIEKKMRDLLSFLGS